MMVSSKIDAVATSNEIIIFVITFDILSFDIVIDIIEEKNEPLHHYNTPYHQQEYAISFISPPNFFVLF